MTTAPRLPAEPSRLPWQLERKPHGRLDFVDATGRRSIDVDVLRAFPVTAAEGHVAIVAEDGTELAWIDALADVDPGLRGLLMEELAAREFLPVIESIEAVSDGDPAEWAVITDRGPRRFTVSGPDDVDRLADSSAVVVDTFGVRYQIRSVTALDPQSRRLFEKNF